MSTASQAVADAGAEAAPLTFEVACPTHGVRVGRAGDRCGGDIGPCGEKLAHRTLEQLGAQMPCGVVDGGKRIRTLAFRPFTLAVEKELGRLRSAAKGRMHVGRVVPEALALTLTRLGPHDFESMSLDRRRMEIGRLVFWDALYAYLRLRYEALEGEPLPLSVVCPACRHSFTLDADLGTIEVRTVPDDRVDLRRPFDLRHPIQMHGREVKRLWIEPPNWTALANIDAGEAADSGARDAAMIRASIVGAAGFEDLKSPFVATDEDLGAMRKYDYEGIIRDIEDNSPGPLMTVEAACPECRTEIARLISDFGYDSFFRRASRATPGRR